MKKRSFTELKDTLFSRLNQASGKKVAHNHKVTTHIGKHPSAPVAFNSFLAVVNDLEPYKTDGLFLAPGILSHTASVEDLLAVITDNYERRGWTVTLP